MTAAIGRQRGQAAWPSLRRGSKRGLAPPAVASVGAKGEAVAERAPGDTRGWASIMWTPPLPSRWTQQGGRVCPFFLGLVQKTQTKKEEVGIWFLPQIPCEPPLPASPSFPLEQGCEDEQGAGPEAGAGGGGGTAAALGKRGRGGGAARGLPCTQESGLVGSPGEGAKGPGA